MVIFIFANFVQIRGKMHAIHKLHQCHKCTSTSVYMGHNANSSLEGDWQTNKQHIQIHHIHCTLPGKHYVCLNILAICNIVIVK